ncbi:MAG: orotate phosphoribosyltransferase [Pseudomonadota bacterium]
MAGPSEIARLLLERRVVTLRPWEPFRFASGILSPIYCDNRFLLSDPEARAQILRGLEEIIWADSVRGIVGVATAGIAWGAWLADRFGKPFAYVRTKAKDHGKQNRLEGGVEAGWTVALVEDLISTGGSLLSAAAALREERIDPVQAVAIFSYGFEEAHLGLERNHIPLATLTRLDDVLTEARSLKIITTEQESEILAWRKAPRDWAPKTFKS